MEGYSFFEAVSPCCYIIQDFQMLAQLLSVYFLCGFNPACGMMGWIKRSALRQHNVFSVCVILLKAFLQLERIVPLSLRESPVGEDSLDCYYHQECMEGHTLSHLLLSILLDDIFLWDISSLTYFHSQSLYKVFSPLALFPHGQIITDTLCFFNCSDGSLNNV